MRAPHSQAPVPLQLRRWRAADLWVFVPDKSDLLAGLQASVRSCLKSQGRAHKTAQVKVPAAKPENLSSSPITHIAREN